ncbi:Conserved_hypothetical protein [Hexamita inflata]|uniref:Transmembrane protein n=1 Tax=Hexamita inflata TaxID=28002 RepID=A0AA86TD15_9EUKA|nr:Conserved hypothetical protein [Hexamita inflata]
MYITQICFASVSSSFSDCFSAKSFIQGNTLTKQINLHLIPFERLQQITSENLCKMYLPGKIVVAQLHYDDISFPKLGQDEINFIYQFNKEIVVTFQLTDPDYNHVIEKQNVMYELWYDVNLVKVNNSINTIEHVKYNGTNCLKDISLKYTIYDDIDIIVTPNSCNIDFTHSVNIYLNYVVENVNKQIQIPPCSTNCVDGQYNSSSLSFKDITIYRIKKTQAATELQEFYNYYVDNRMISISLTINFLTNGVQTILQQPINNKVSVDTWNCVAVDPPTSSYWGMYLYTILTANGLFVQIRDTLVNKLKCDTSSAVNVRLDHYMFQKEQQNQFYRQQQMLLIEDYNNKVGIQFESNHIYSNYRQNIFMNDTTYSLIILSFLDSNDNILYEISQYGKAYLGCISQQTLKLYNSQMCATIIFEDDPGCRLQYQDSTLRNHISLFYTHDHQFKFLGFYNFVQEVNYSHYETTICFTCDQYDPTYQDMYEGKTCIENFQLMSTQLKLLSGSQTGFYYCNNFEINPSVEVLVMYNNTWVPFYIAVGILSIVACIIIVLLKITQN